MTALEQMSRALFTCEWLAFDRGLIADPEGFKADMLARAASGLSAIREPTDAMLDAGWEHTAHPCWRENVRDCWRAMVDTALSDSGRHPKGENAAGG